MKWNHTTVPTHVEERHDLSILLGKAFAQAYKIYPAGEDTQQILEIYKESRRMVDRPGGYPPSGRLNCSRYGSLEAYNATQGF